MERVFIGVADATRLADEWWSRQKGLRQTLRTEVAVGGIGAPHGAGAFTLMARCYCVHKITSVWIRIPRRLIPTINEG
jgi:hypothetical protein